jgi:hypothetical protein
MKSLLDSLRFAVINVWRGRRPVDRNDPADMGTAFGLDSITVIDFDSTAAPPAAPDLRPDAAWQRRVARRSSL